MKINLEILALIPNYCESTWPIVLWHLTISFSFKLLKHAMSFSLNFFSVPQTALQDCGKKYLPMFDVVLGVRVGFVPFMEIDCINPLLAAR
jgi:hypothetical protein